MKVDFDKVGCLSAFDLAHDRVSVLQAAGASPSSLREIRMVELTDVLYLPNILEPGQSICLADQRFVPRESILDCWSVEFLLTSRKNNPEYQGKYADHFDVDMCRERVCVLGNLFSRNFGHWTEELLKVALLEESDQGCRYVMPTLPSFARQFLLLLGVDESRIISINTPTVLARAVFTTAISHDNIAEYPSALLQLRQMAQSRLGDGSSNFGTRLWLERAEQLRSGGVTLNRDEVYRCLEKYSFDIIDMAALSVADQLRTMRGATTIAGPHGSQFVHAQFMPLSSNVIECFSPAHVNPSILQICRTLKHSYHQIVARTHLLAPYPYGRDCQVDCEHLALMLDSLAR